MAALLLAFAAGVLTIAAPCILPMLPVILGASVGRTSRVRPMFITLGFVLAFAAAALAFGAFAERLADSAEALREVAIFLLLVFGLLMVFPHPVYWLATRMHWVVNTADAIGRRAGSGNAGGFVLGMTLGVVWTPCAGPVLGSILTLIATAHDLGWSALLLLAYAVGSGLPMLAIAYGGQYVTTRVRSFAHHAHRLQQAFGVIVILVAIGLYYQYDTLVTVWLSNFYPNGNMGL